MTIKPDIMFVFLLQSDRSCDDDERGSLYHRIYSKLLRRRIARANYGYHSEAEPAAS